MCARSWAPSIVFPSAVPVYSTRVQHLEFTFAFQRATQSVESKVGQAKERLRLFRAQTREHVGAEIQILPTPRVPVSIFTKSLNCEAVWP